MRTLRPARLVLLDSGLWALDAFQPVAAVLEPSTGRVLRVVSWPQLPPAGADEEWPGPQVLADGGHLWVQHNVGGPLARIGLGGAEVVVWTDGLRLAACDGGVAWCAPAPPVQELTVGDEVSSATSFGYGRLLRVDAQGQCTPVMVAAQVRSLRVAPEGLLVEVDVDPLRQHNVGNRVQEVVRATHWLLVPHDAPVPGMISVDTHGLPEGGGGAVRPGGNADGNTPARFSWHDPSPRPGRYSDRPGSIAAGGLAWHLGWAPDHIRDEAGLWRAVVGTGHDEDGAEVQRHDLGRGTVIAATAVADRLVIAVARGPWRPHPQHSAVDVLVLDPARATVEVLLLGDGVDITGHRWPLVTKPVDADSYAHQVLRANESIDACWQGPDGVQPLSRGLSHARTELIGSWPDTSLQWTFDFAAYPGLRLQRRVPLFDELGRPTRPDHASIHLMEDLDTRALPPASAAREGLLDI